MFIRMISRIGCGLTLLSLALSFEGPACHEHTNCVDCTESSPRVCAWKVDIISNCAERVSVTDGKSVYYFDDTCPIQYAESSKFLQNWMGELLPVIEDLTLLDLSLPGTHDTLTHDLSTRVSEGGMDDALILAEVLHNYTSVSPYDNSPAGNIGDFIRKQAQTQDLNVKEQLDAGIRFFDFRNMLEYTDVEADWRSLHMVQSKGLAIDYYKQIRDWIDDHPHELVVLFVSKHGSQCKTGQDQYPNVSVEQKQLYWNEILAVFEGVVVDFSVTKLNETTIGDMLERNHRVIFYVADYVEMTNSSVFAMDQCDGVDNGSKNPGVFRLEEAIPWQREMYANATDRKKEAKRVNQFYKVSLATGGSMTQMVAATILNFFPSSEKHNLSRVTEKCADEFGVPGMNWCPETLLDIAQLESYYTQIAMSEILEHDDWSLPNGIYLNGVDVDGVIRTGTQVLWGGIRNEADADHWTTGFAYSDTFVAVNLRLACARLTMHVEGSLKCVELWKKVNERLSAHPLTLWNDTSLGRSTIWPDV